MGLREANGERENPKASLWTPGSIHTWSRTTPFLDDLRTSQFPLGHKTVWPMFLFEGVLEDREVKRVGSKILELGIQNQVSLLTAQTWLPLPTCGTRADACNSGWRDRANGKRYGLVPHRGTGAWAPKSLTWDWALRETTQLNPCRDDVSPQAPNPLKRFKRQDNRSMAYLFTIGPKKGIQASFN